jgi:large subunit ribosomal protein L35Ae
MSESETLLKTLRGVIVNYRTGPKTQRPKEYIVQFPNINTANQAAQLIGRKVAWPVGERKIRGKIVAVHGKNGQVRVRFRKGLPGQVGVPIEIIG